MKKLVFPFLIISSLTIGCSSDTNEMIPNEEPNTQGEDPGTPDEPDAPNSDTPNLTFLRGGNFGGTDSDTAFSIARTNENGFVFAGRTGSNAYLVGADNDLNMLWEKSFLGDDGVFHSVINSNDGNLIAVGSINNEVYVVKFQTNGNIIWEQTLGGSQGEFARGIVETNDLGFVIIGSTNSSDGIFSDPKGGNDAFALKLDAEGNLIWSNTYGGSQTDILIDLINENDGGFLIVGSTASNDGDVKNNKGLEDIWILRISSNGELLNENTIGSSGNDFVSGITSMQNGNYAISATNSPILDGDVTFSNGGSDAWILLIDPSLNIIGQANFGAERGESGNQIVEVPNGDLIFISNFVASNASETNIQSDYWVVRLSPKLEIIDQLTLGGSGSDLPYDALLFEENSLILTGESISSDGDIIVNNGGFDIWSVIIDISGE
ncbi:MAG: hypothetical protein WBG90_18530 [Saonia sp.]